MTKKSILILTADAGFGHRNAANAIATAIEERYAEECEVIVVNPLDDKRAPFFLRDSAADYDRVVRRMPELYRFYYDASDTTVTSALVESTLTVLLFEILLDMVRTYQPDAIVSTYPLYLTPVESVFTIRREDIPVVSVVTDLATVHRIWFNKSVEKCLVPNDIVRDLALNYGLTPEQVEVTGIPVNPALVKDKRPPRELRRELGWQQDITTFLAVGSRRVDRLIDTLNVLNHFGSPLQLAVVAGKDEQLYSELKQIEWHVPVHLYEFVDNVPTMMRAADAVICKAGGLVVTESLAAGKPMLLVDVIPGQETGNAELVVGSGAGDLARNDMEVLETIAHWFREGGKLMKERAANAVHLGKPYAAYDAADQVFMAAKRGPTPHRRLLSRGSLIDLLNRNQVRWGESREARDADSG